MQVSTLGCGNASFMPMSGWGASASQGVARNTVRDDIVVLLDRDQAAVVHLTWTASPPEHPPFPHTQVVADEPANKLRTTWLGMEPPRTLRRGVRGGFRHAAQQGDLPRRAT